jgi:hypothetical protein
MSRSINISKLVAAALTVAALAAPSALADPLPIRLAEESQAPVRSDVDGYQPQLHGASQSRGVVGPSRGNEGPDGFQPQLRVPATVAATAASDGVDWLDATIGGAIGLALAFVLFASAQVTRGRTRIAHS